MRVCEHFIVFEEVSLFQEISRGIRIGSEIEFMKATIWWVGLVRKLIVFPIS